MLNSRSETTYKVKTLSDRRKGKMDWTFKPQANEQRYILETKVMCKVLM